MGSRMPNRKRLLIVTIQTLLLMLPITAFATDDSIQPHTKRQGWTFDIEPYLMATNISGDASIGRVSGINVDVDFGDILETLQLAGMLHFEARHGSGWGIWLDYGFMDLEQDTTGPAGGIASANLRQGVMEAFGLYRHELSRGSLDLYSGVRWWDNDIDAKIDPAILPGSIQINKDVNWVDLVVGARWTYQFSENWFMRLRGDIGGFGLEADFTATTWASVSYMINDLIDLNLAFKATWVDYEEGTQGTPIYFAYDTVTYGPILGVNFKL